MCIFEKTIILLHEKTSSCFTTFFKFFSSRFSRRLSRRFLKSPLEPLISPQPDDINNANACDSSDSSDSDSEDETSKTKISQLLLLMKMYQCTVEPLFEDHPDEGPNPIERPEQCYPNMNVLISAPDERPSLLKEHLPDAKGVTSQEGPHCIYVCIYIYKCVYSFTCICIFNYSRTPGFASFTRSFLVTLNE